MVKRGWMARSTLIGAVCGAMAVGCLPNAAAAVAVTRVQATASTDAVTAVVAELRAAGQTCPQPGRLLSETTLAVPEANDFVGNPVTATVYKIAGPFGTITEAIPPNGWRPATATEAELAYFGIPARPSSPAALTEWQYYWVQHFSAITLTIPCGVLETESDGLEQAAKVASGGGIVPMVVPDSVPSEPPSPNWSGSVTTNTTSNITEAVGTTIWYDASTCSAPSGWAHWVGIGGYNVPELIQNGFIQGQSGGSSLFWEAIGNGIGLPAETLAPSLVANADIQYGDTVRLATSFHDGTAQFIWHDLDTGGAAILPKSSFTIEINGQLQTFPASEFYNGNSGEVIDERPEVSVNGTPTYERLQDFGFDGWSAVDFADHQYVREPMEDWNYHELDMVSGGTSYADAQDFTAAGFGVSHESCGSTTPVP